MNRNVLLLVLAFLYFQLNSQLLPNRYNEEIFSNYTETSEVLFSTGVPQPKPGGGFYEWITGYPLNVNEWETTDEDLYMDIFEPTGDTISKRPLVIICFGGGFVAGSKDHWSMREIAIQLAKRGYVTATIDYRLGMNMFDEDLSKRAPYRGLQDGRSAIRYFRADADGANTYKIDTSNIYIGGHSAGAFIGLHNAYLDKESERPLSTYTWLQDGETCEDLQCLDCVGDNTGYSGYANAVFSLAGALGSVDYIESGDMPSVVMFHSEDDGTVPYDSGEPFSDITWLIIGDDLPVVYGSQAIADEADIVGLDYIFNSYSDRGHSVHEETDSELYDDIIPGISDSFYYQLLKPIAHPILGAKTVCSEDLQNHIYKTIEGEAKYYDWEVIGGSIVNSNTLSNQVFVNWDIGAAEHKIYLTPYSCTAARGDKDSLIIQIKDSGINFWQAGNGVWNDPASWSLGHIPLACEDVVFQDETTSEDVFVPASENAVARSIYLGENVNLFINQESSLTLETGGNINVLGELTVSDTVSIKHLRPLYSEHLNIEGSVKINVGGFIYSQE